MKATVARVNKELKRLGHPERLRRGRGYYYFVDGKAHEWYSSSVYVYRVESLTLGQWIQKREELAK